MDNVECIICGNEIVIQLQKHIENRKFCGPDKLTWNTGLQHDHLEYGLIQPWKGCNPSAQHVMYAHSNSEYIVKGDEQINRFGSGKQSQQITIRKKSEKNTNKLRSHSSKPVSYKNLPAHETDS